MTPHPYRLRAYHNPENAPQHRIPRGWRLLYADEAGRPQNKPCRIWLGELCEFDFCAHWRGNFMSMTYIVPLDA